MFSGQTSVDSDKLLSNAQPSLDDDDIPIPEVPHTLENYSMQHFNPPPKKTISKTLNSIRKIRKDIPWLFSKVSSSLGHVCVLQILEELHIRTFLLD